MNIREKILSAKDIQEEIVEVKEWGVKVLVKGLTATERNKILKETTIKKGFDPKGNPIIEQSFEKMQPEILIACIYDPETNEKIFKPADRESLSKKSSKAVDRIFKVAAKLSGLDEAEVEKNS